MQKPQKNRDVKICSLFSGSKGNSLYISANGKNILIDAGKSARAIERALACVGSSLSKIDAIFITHEHTDHVGALEIISKRHKIPIHITNRSAAQVCARSPYLRENVVPHKPRFCVDIGGVLVKSFLTPHDSVSSVGYVVEFESGGKLHKIGHATDIGMITDEIRCALTGCDYVIIESNHDINMLKNGSYPAFLKRRILSDHGHLSNAECASFLPELVNSGTKKILLAHLSDENNLPSIAYECCRRSLLTHFTESCFELAVADNKEITPLCV